MKNIGIVGATGAVGQEILGVLEKRNFPINNLKLLASSRNAGKKITFKGKEYTVEELDENSYKGLDIMLFAAGGSVSEKYARAAAENGVVVIDNSSAFRNDPDVPLIVPEVNAGDIKNHKGIIANPNCSTIQMCVALWPIYKKYGIKKIIMSTYQASSGAGKEGMEELIEQAKEFSAGKDMTVNYFRHQLMFNVIPHIDSFTENDYTKEEMKVVHETHKIFHDESIKISVTAVRVPVLRAHSEAITLELGEKATAKEVKELLASSEGIVLQDDIKNDVYPMPYFTATKDETYVGRIREDLVFENGISLWVVADQILKGAALNAVQIAELL
ncbi:MAG: aspartate-semialdehyde dehydrogenase [Fusobacteria bacterium]|nr:aspartate-semialdehyde dehydrogenase [Fusobacteriota bacterium]